MPRWDPQREMGTAQLAVGKRDEAAITVKKLRMVDTSGCVAVVLQRDDDGLPVKWMELSGPAGRRAAKVPHAVVIP